MVSDIPSYRPLTRHVAAPILRLVAENRKKSRACAGRCARDVPQSQDHWTGIMTGELKLDAGWPLLGPQVPKKFPEQV